MEMDKRTNELIQANFPQFESGADGYPVPGKVIRYYREKLVYTDRNGKRKHWTQADLARQLGLTEIMVNFMENKNQGLDSIERRRALAALLKIPPVLLGLGTLDQIELTFKSVKPALQGTNAISPDTIQFYQDTLGTYKQQYHNGMSYAIISEVEVAAKYIEQATKKLMSDSKSILYVLWQYEILCANIYGNDMHDWNMAFRHIDNAKDVAVCLDDKDLLAASLCRSAMLRYRQGRLGLARIDIDAASMYSRGAFPQTRGIILSKQGCIYSDTDLSDTGIIIVQKLFNDAEKYINVPSEIVNMPFKKDDYLLDKTQALMHTRPAKALELLDDAEQYIQSVGRKHMVYLDIKRSTCYIQQRSPEYEYATSLLLMAAEASRGQRVARNTSHIQKLYNKLVMSSYGNSPEVAELGLALRELQLKFTSFP